MLPVLLMLVGAYFVLGISGSTVMIAISVMCITYAFQLYLTQENILYQPRSADQIIKNPPQYYNTPEDYGLQYQRVRIKTLDGKELDAFYVPAHRYDDEKKCYVPIINKKIAKTIALQAKKLSQIDCDDDYNNNNNNNNNELKRILEDESDEENEEEESEEVIEFTTPASRHAKNWKDESLSSLSSSSSTTSSTTTNTTNTSTTTTTTTTNNKNNNNDNNDNNDNRKRKESIINQFFNQNHNQSADLCPTSTYNLDLLVNDDKCHIDKDIATFLWFHGNAGSIHLRLPQLFHTVTTQLANVLIVDYRSYGESTRVDVVTEEGLVVDAVSSFVYLQERVDINPNFTFIFGQSLGSAVTIALTESIEIAMSRRDRYKKDDIDDNHDDDNDDDNDDEKKRKNNNQEKEELKREHVTFDNKNLGHPGLDITDIISPRLISITPPCGIVIENTFTSIGDLVNHLFPFLSPIKGLLLKLKWYNLQRFKRIKKTPVLFISSLQDEIIPPEMMKVLHDGVPHDNKAMYFVPQGHHNDPWITGGSSYYIKLQQFIQYTAAKQNVRSITALADNNDHNFIHTSGSFINNDKSSTRESDFTHVLIQPTVEQLRAAIDDVNKVMLALTLGQFGSMEALKAYLKANGK